MFPDPRFAILLVVGKCFPGPFPGDQDAASAEAEGFPAVDLALAPSGHESGPGVFRLDAVEQPVGAARRARFVPQGIGKPVDMRPLRVRLHRMAGIQRLRQIFGQVADQPSGVAAVRGHPVRADLHAEPDNVRGFFVVLDGVQRLIPRRQRPARVRVDVAGLLVPDGQPAGAVERPVAGWPPDLVIRRRRDLAEQHPRDRPAHRRMQMRRQAALRFQAGEILDVVPHRPAQVLPETVHELGKVDRVAGRPPIVIRHRIHRGAFRGHPPVAVAGEGEEHRRPPHRPIRPGKRPPHRPPIHRQPWQVRGILPAPC